MKNFAADAAQAHHHGNHLVNNISKAIESWRDCDAYDLLVLYGIWPDSIEEKQRLYDYACQQIDYFQGNSVTLREATKQALKKQAGL